MANQNADITSSWVVACPASEYVKRNASVVSDRGGSKDTAVLRVHLLGEDGYTDDDPAADEELEGKVGIIHMH